MDFKLKALAFKITAIVAFETTPKSEDTPLGKLVHYCSTVGRKHRMAAKTKILAYFKLQTKVVSLFFLLQEETEAKINKVLRYIVLVADPPELQYLIPRNE